jgi:hypothetical protein
MDTRTRSNIGCRTFARLPVIALFMVGSIPLGAQQSANPVSPQEVLKAYRSMDSEGKRLTDDGWYAGAKFFLKPARPPQKRVLAVMDGERVDTSAVPKAGAVEVQVLCSAVGQINPSGRLTFSMATLIDSSGHLIKDPGSDSLHGPSAALVRVYDLVLSDTHWTFGPKREGPIEVKGPAEWRIKTFEFEPWVTIETAIRYLTQLRASSTSEAVKQNADESILKLRHLLEH